MNTGKQDFNISTTWMIVGPVQVAYSKHHKRQNMSIYEWHALQGGAGGKERELRDLVKEVQAHNIPEKKVTILCRDWDPPHKCLFDKSTPGMSSGTTGYRYTLAVVSSITGLIHAGCLVDNH